MNCFSFTKRSNRNELYTVTVTESGQQLMGLMSPIQSQGPVPLTLKKPSLVTEPLLNLLPQELTRPTEAKQCSNNSNKNYVLIKNSCSHITCSLYQCNKGKTYHELPSGIVLL